MAAAPLCALWGTSQHFLHRTFPQGHAAGTEVPLETWVSRGQSPSFLLCLYVPQVPTTGLCTQQCSVKCKPGIRTVNPKRTGSAPNKFPWVPSVFGRNYLAIVLFVVDVVVVAEKRQSERGPQVINSNRTPWGTEPPERRARTVKEAIPSKNKQQQQKTTHNRGTRLSCLVRTSGESRWLLLFLRGP